MAFDGDIESEQMVISLRGALVAGEQEIRQLVGEHNLPAHPTSLLHTCNPHKAPQHFTVAKGFVLVLAGSTIILFFSDFTG